MKTVSLTESANNAPIIIFINQILWYKSYKQGTDIGMADGSIHVTEDVETVTTKIEAALK